MPNSQFFFTGSCILSGLFALAGLWPLLSVSFLVMLVGIWRADCEQITEMAPATLAMLVPHDDMALQPLDRFYGIDLLFYESGCPVYRLLREGARFWELAGHDGEVDREPEMIRIFPGLLYRPHQPHGG